MRKFLERGFGCKVLAGYIHPAPSATSSQKISTPARRPCGTIWPNGEFGLGYHQEREESDPFVPDKAGGVSVQVIREECARVSDGAEPLGLSSLPNSHKSHNRPETYGRRGLSGYGGKFIRNAGFCLQRDHRKELLSFLTLTLPELPRQEAVKVALTWGETIRQLVQYLSRQLIKAGLPAQIALVSELQQQRMRAGSLSVLHVHAVFVGRRPGKAWAITPKEVRKWWLKRLSRVTGGEVVSVNCVDMKPVRKDAGNYLSKYMSKGSEAIAQYAEEVGWDAVPRQWWNVSKAMRERVKRACLTSESIMATLDQMVWNYRMGEDESSFKFVRSIEVQATEFQSFVVGYWGKLKPPALRDLQELAAGLEYYRSV